LVLDKSKTSEQYIREAEGIYIVPIIIRERYPDLIKLIVETESMDTEEREYWLSIMPVMNEDQIIKLRNILLNEKEQLFKIEQQYQQQGKTSSPAIDEEKLRERIERIQEAERSVEAEERQREEELFRMLEEV
jgi:predicted pyridoxine 5'-phosphate oxidase superfamily flavin-nucleotide-binding protein